MLPQLTGAQVVRALTKIGYYIARQKGSHISLRGGPGAALTIPDHDPIAKGTLRSIIRDAGLTVDEFVALL